MKRSKYYAEFCNTSDWAIITATTRDIGIANAKLDGRKDELDRFTYMNGYNTLKEAKGYIRMHLQGEINDAKVSLKQLSKLKQNEL